MILSWTTPSHWRHYVPQDSRNIAWSTTNTLLLLLLCPLYIRHKSCTLALVGPFVLAWFPPSMWRRYPLAKGLVFGLKSAACKYCTSSYFYVCVIMLFVTASDCCIYRGTSHIPACLFLVSLIIYCTFYGLTYIFCLVWWCIHHHIRLPMILVGIYSFLGNCGSDSLTCLDLIVGVLWCVRTQLCSHLVVLLSFKLTLLEGPF